MIAATHNLVIYSHTLVPMRRTLLFPLFAILFVTLLTACNKTEAPTTEPGVTNAAQGAGILPAASPDAADIIDATDQNLSEADALIMANGLALAQKNNCLACHKIDEKLVGPAWRDVAKKYKGVAGIEHKLVIIVSTGGVGHWGDMPMPAMAPAVKEEDIRALVQFVLSLEK